MARQLSQLYDGNTHHTQEPLEGSALEDLRNPDDEDSVIFFAIF